MEGNYTQSAKGFFVTGTDTDVGKTIITAALIKASGLLGFRTCGMKPIETGCLREGDIFIPSDGIFIKTIAHMKQTVDHISPCCFEEPLAPLPASEIEGTPVDLEKIRKEYAALSQEYDAVVVEGIGGLLVPIRKDYFILDLARDLGLPVIIVSRPGLGTINHTMLSVNYAMKEGLTVAGIIINYSRPLEGSPAENTNPDVIKKISPVPIIGIFPYLKDLEETTIERAVVKSLNLEILRTYLS
jgi:dethiobiotin synthetase